MQLTNLVVLAAALGATAHPSGHARFHEKRAPAFYKAVHSQLPPPATTAAAPAPAATPAQAAPAAVSASSAQYKPFCAGLTRKRASAADIASKGNVGVDGHWGCNIMTIDSSIAHLYDYTQVFTNTASEEYEVVCFNKIGPTGAIDGFWHSALTFRLAPHASQTVAFDKNSQGGCAFGPNSVPKTSVGQFAGSWVEFDFGSDRNGGWSGADCSSLVAASAGLSIPGCQVCAGQTCSTIFPGGQGNNAFTAGTEALDGLGLNLPAGPVSLNVKVGYSG